MIGRSQGCAPAEREPVTRGLVLDAGALFELALAHGAAPMQREPTAPLGPLAPPPGLAARRVALCGAA